MTDDQTVPCEALYTQAVQATADTHSSCWQEAAGVDDSTEREDQRTWIFPHGEKIHNSIHNSRRSNRNILYSIGHHSRHS